MMSLFLSVSLMFTLLGQTSSTDRRLDDPAARLDFMEKAVAVYTIHALDGPKTTFRLRTDPVLRFTNPLAGLREGAIFCWLGECDRPEAVLQMFEKPGGSWIQEFTSLSNGPLSAESRAGKAWSASRGGVEFKPVPGAPRPAATPDQRIRQMRAIAEDFTVDDFDRNISWQRLRRLPKPFLRYGKQDCEPIDGVLICFVLTTDPEALLTIEARRGKDGPEWQYSFAPMTIWAIRGRCRGAEVWSLPYRPPSSNADGPFIVRQYRPEG
jgi:hypothetical protein